MVGLTPSTRTTLFDTRAASRSPVPSYGPSPEGSRSPSPSSHARAGTSSPTPTRPPSPLPQRERSPSPQRDMVDGSAPVPWRTAYPSRRHGVPASSECEMDDDEANIRIDRRELKLKVQENAQVQRAQNEQMKAENERHFNFTQVKCLTPCLSFCCLPPPPSSFSFLLLLPPPPSSHSFLLLLPPPLLHPPLNLLSHPRSSIRRAAPARATLSSRNTASTQSIRSSSRGHSRRLVALYASRSSEDRCSFSPHPPSYEPGATRGGVESGEEGSSVRLPLDTMWQCSWHRACGL